MRKDYDTVGDSLPDFRTRFTFKEFVSTYMLVKSRSFTMDHKTMMVPYGDFGNHQNPPETEWIFGIRDENWSMAGLQRGEEYTKGFLLYAKASIAKGQQIYISYGTKTNEELLRSYGFVQPNNVDKLRLQFKLAINSAVDPMEA